MGVNMIVKVVQLQHQINVNVVKPGFTTSIHSKYHSRSEHAFTMP